VVKVVLGGIVLPWQLVVGEGRQQLGCSLSRGCEGGAHDAAGEHLDGLTNADSLTPRHDKMVRHSGQQPLHVAHAQQLEDAEVPRQPCQRDPVGLVAHTPQ